MLQTVTTDKIWFEKYPYDCIAASNLTVEATGDPDNRFPCIDLDTLNFQPITQNIKHHTYQIGSSSQMQKLFSAKTQALFQHQNTQTMETDQPIEEILFEEALSEDLVFKLPPVREYAIKMRVIGIETPKPVFIDTWDI